MIPPKTANSPLPQSPSPATIPDMKHTYAIRSFAEVPPDPPARSPRPRPDSSPSNAPASMVKAPHSFSPQHNNESPFSPELAIKTPFVSHHRKKGSQTKRIIFTTTTPLPHPLTLSLSKGRADGGRPPTPSHHPPIRHSGESRNPVPPPSPPPQVIYSPHHSINKSHTR